MPQIKPRVLIADDEKVIANTLAMILNQSGFDAHAVYSGEKALEMVQSVTPDILISDVIMSGISGIETAIRVRAILPSFKVLLFSGQAATANLLEETRVQGYEFELLTKPVHPADLLARIRTAAPQDARYLASK
jgi:DNA-binding response OmpR family regulator